MSGSAGHDLAGASQQKPAKLMARIEPRIEPRVQIYSSAPTIPSATEIRRNRISFDSPSPSALSRTLPMNPVHSGTPPPREGSLSTPSFKASQFRIFRRDTFNRLRSASPAHPAVGAATPSAPSSPKMDETPFASSSGGGGSLSGTPSLHSTGDNGPPLSAGVLDGYSRRYSDIGRWGSSESGFDYRSSVNYSVSELAMPIDVDYRTLPPEEVAHHLFHLTLPGISKVDVAGIIGEKDLFNQEVLEFYMRQFNFVYDDLDVALRRVSAHLHFAGEAQVLDRILLQVARRYWECNPDAHSIYISPDILHGIYFSVFLLNTDLHVVNVGQNASKRMTKKEFVKNTIEGINDIVAKDDGLSAKFKDMGQAKVRVWRKDMEQQLEDDGLAAKIKNMYKSVKEERIVLESPATPPVDTISQPRRSRLKAFVAMTSPLAPMPSRASAAESSGPTAPKSQAASVLGSEAESEGVRSASSSAPGVSNEVGVAKDGFIVRKHVLDTAGVKARHRKWIKTWAVMLVDDRGVELAFYKVDQNSTNEDLERAAAQAVDSGVLLDPSTGRLPPGKLADGSTFLLEAPSAELALDWTRTLNYWAARRSKEPLRGALSNVEFGWSDAAWERIERDRAESADAGSWSSGAAARGGGGGGQVARPPRIEEW
ncbi:hypothetical protein HK405_010579, partial [Cladochytrium tenue]